jgi:hypothetical protein
MIDTDKYEEHYGMTYEQLLKRYKDLEVDDYKDLLTEVKRLREGIKAYLLRYLPEELEHHELKELIE